MHKILSTSILLICWILCLSGMTSTELQTGKVQEGVLRDGKGPTYTLTLKTGDYVESAVDRHNTELIITVYDPASL